MEEEIDFRQYVNVLIRQWKWILALAVAAAVAAMVVSFLLPPTYQARALVIVTRPRYVMRFDTKFETVDNVLQPYKAYPALALGDQILLKTIDALEPPLPQEEQTLAHFRPKLDATSGSDPSVVELRVKGHDAEQAQRITNTWADVFVAQVNELYDESVQDARFFETQLQTADGVLARAEQALVEFQGRNQAGVLQVQVIALTEQFSTCLQAQNTIGWVSQDAASLKARLALQEGDASSSPADDLAALLLQIEALNLKSELPLQLQVGDSSAVSNMTRQELMAFLDGLMASLEVQSDDLAIKVAGIAPEIMRLQEELQKFITEQNRLTLARDVALDTYTTLARKVDEARIAAQDESGEVRLASYAAVPTQPVGPKKMLNTVVAGALGLFIGVLGAFVAEYWRQGAMPGRQLEDEK